MEKRTLYAGTHKRILIHYGLWTDFLFSEFSYSFLTALNIIKFHIYFYHGQKHVNYTIWDELRAWLIYRATQNNSGMWMIKAGKCRSFISCYFIQILSKLNFKYTIRYIGIYIQCTGLFKIDQTCSFLHGVLSQLFWIFWSDFLNWIPFLNIFLFMQVESPLKNYKKNLSITHFKKLSSKNINNNYKSR